MGVKLLSLQRKREPELRGVFRIPLNRGGVIVLATLPIIILLSVIAMSFRDGEYGLPAIIGSANAIALGPLMYQLVSPTFTPPMRIKTAGRSCAR